MHFRVTLITFILSRAGCTAILTLITPTIPPRVVSSLTLITASVYRVALITVTCVTLQATVALVQEHAWRAPLAAKAHEALHAVISALLAPAVVQVVVFVADVTFFRAEVGADPAVGILAGGVDA